MPLFAGFCNGTYEHRSLSLDAEKTVNLYFETIESSANAKKSVLIGTPALKLLGQAADTGCRGAYTVDGRTFMVFGPTLYEINTSTGVATSRGAIANDSKRVSMVSNGRGGEQLMIVGGGQVKILTLTNNSLSASITLPLTNAPVMGDFIDGYFILSEANTIRMWFSNLNDGTTWNALNFFSRSQVNDNVVGIKVMGQRLWSFGSLTTQVFYDSGDATTPFVPYPGSVMHQGAVSAWAISLIEDAQVLVWLSENSAGAKRILRASSYAPQAISTPAIEFALASYTSVTDAESDPYEQEGHPFVAFTFPTGDATFVWDQRESQWHQRDWVDSNGVSHRWRTRGITAAGSTVIVAGDYALANFYTLDLDTFTDYCNALRRLRRTPYVTGENQWIFLDQFELGMQPGVGNASVASPNVNLRLSRDGGQTYGQTVSTTLGAAGASLTRAIWRALGRVRGDRLVIEVTQTDAARAVWGPGAWLRVTPGSGQL